MCRAFVFVVSTVLLLALAAAAQESRSEISLQGTGFFTSGTSGNGTTYRATGAGGFLAGYRYRLNRWLSAEAVYGMDRNTQKYLLNSGDFRIQSNAHQVTGGLVVSLPPFARRRFSPYALAEGGALVFDPTGNQFDIGTTSQSQTRGVFVYGGGVNYSILRRISLRAEYRGLIYKTPDFGFGGLSTNSITHTAQPSVGLAFRF
jgi:opacity protein-like surface antigen